MYKFILAIGILAIAFPTMANNDWYNIKFSDDIQKDCVSQEFGLKGCIYESTGDIIIKKGMNFKLTQETIAHEIGHWYLRFTPKEKYIEVFGFPNEPITELKEIGARNFSKWYFQRDIIITKP